MGRARRCGEAMACWRRRPVADPQARATAAGRRRSRSRKCRLFSVRTAQIFAAAPASFNGPATSRSCMPSPLLPSFTTMIGRSVDKRRVRSRFQEPAPQRAQAVHRIGGADVDTELGPPERNLRAHRFRRHRPMAPPPRPPGSGSRRCRSGTCSARSVFAAAASGGAMIDREAISGVAGDGFAASGFAMSALACPVLAEFGLAAFRLGDFDLGAFDLGKFGPAAVTLGRIRFHHVALHGIPGHGRNRRAWFRGVTCGLVGAGVGGSDRRDGRGRRALSGQQLLLAVVRPVRDVDARWRRSRIPAPVPGR